MYPLRHNLMATQFRIDSSKPYATYVNNSIELLNSPFMTPAALRNQAVSAYYGDPLVGQVVPPGGSMKWDNLTQVQMAIYNYYAIMGLKLDGVDAEMQQNPGPSELWNYSYTQFGLPLPTPPAL